MRACHLLYGADYVFSYHRPGLFVHCRIRRDDAFDRNRVPNPLPAIPSSCRRHIGRFFFPFLIRVPVDPFYLYLALLYLLIVGFV